MTITELRDAAAEMLGFKNYASAKPEQSRITRDVKRAIYEAFLPVDKSRLQFGEKAFGIEVPAPITATIIVAAGSNEFTHSGDIPESTFRGSYVILGDKFYTFQEKVDGTTGRFVEPWEGTSQTISARFFHNSIVLDDKVWDVQGDPEIIGYGKLSALTGKRQEIRFSSLVHNDYWPVDGVLYYNSLAIRGGADNSLLVGTPTFYFVDDTMMGSAFGRRLSVHPIPDQKHSIRGRAMMAPTIPSVGSEDVPFPGPADFAEICLVPILEKIVSSSKRYAGKNQREIQTEYITALEHIKGFSKPQKVHNNRLRVRRGY